jgi:hypothetical protein
MTESKDPMFLLVPKELIQPAKEITEGYSSKKTEFVTSENEHWYPSKTKANVWYPSVTTIIGDSFPKGIGFQKYLANQESYESSQDILKAAGKRGTNVHEATEVLERGHILYRDNFTLEEWTMLQGFVAWHKKYNPRPIHIERGWVSDQLETGGTIDRVYDIQGDIVVLDIKTSSAVHQNYFCQVAVYDRLLTEHTTLVADYTAILRLAPKKKDGYEYVLRDRDEIEEDFAVFQSVQKIWKYRNPKAKPKIIEVPTTLSLK